MATIKIHKTDGTAGDSLELADTVFGEAPNADCVRDVVAQYLANQRAGSHATKTRGEVRGGGRKPYRQKGTGRARQGSIRAVQWRGGAIAFGPRPRDYSFRVNQKVRQKAFCSVLSELLRNERLIVVDQFGIKEPKTKRMVEILGRLGVDGSALIITEGTDEALCLSARNLGRARDVKGRVSVLNSENLNIFDLITHDWVVATTDALKILEERYA